jgi:hypothetical protein
MKLAVATLMFSLLASSVSFTLAKPEDVLSDTVAPVEPTLNNSSHPANHTADSPVQSDGIALQAGNGTAVEMDNDKDATITNVPKDEKKKETNATTATIDTNSTYTPVNNNDLDETVVEKSQKENEKGTLENKSSAQTVAVNDSGDKKDAVPTTSTSNDSNKLTAVTESSWEHADKATLASSPTKQSEDAHKEALDTESEPLTLNKVSASVMDSIDETMLSSDVPSDMPTSAPVSTPINSLMPSIASGLGGYRRNLRG